MIPTQDDNETARQLNGIIEKRKKWDTYTFAGVAVPRVSELLKECIGKEYLMKWAANLGKSYYKESSQTLYIGTLVHEMIEHFLLFGTHKEIDFFSYNVRIKTEKAFKNFLNWYNDRIKQGFKIIPMNIEKPTTNPWFGGTIDCIMQFEYNGIVRNYVMDFKTSKKITMDYILQTYAYYWSENWNATYIEYNTNPILDGIGIIRIDKEKDTYEDLILDFNNPDNLMFLSDIDTALGSIINWFYHIQNMNANLKAMRKKREGGYVNGICRAES